MKGPRGTKVDLGRLPLMIARGLSDRAIARVFGVSRDHVFDLRHRLGLPGRPCPNRRAEFRARHAELDRLWAGLALEEKVALLLRVEPAREDSASLSAGTEPMR